jgi:hypothetical protein
LLTFEDAWKAAGVQEGSPQSGAVVGGSQRLAQCYSKVFGCISDIIHKVRRCLDVHKHRVADWRPVYIVLRVLQKRARTVEQMWTHWLSARLAEQERLAFAQRLPEVAPLTAPTSPKLASSAVSAASGSAAISAAAVDAAATIANVVAAITGGAASTPAASSTANSAGQEKMNGPALAPSDALSKVAQAALEGSQHEEKSAHEATSSSASAGDDAEWILKALSGEFTESEWESPADTDTGAAGPGEGATSRGVVRKTAAGVTTQVRGDSGILSARHMQLLEEVIYVLT